MGFRSKDGVDRFFDGLSIIRSIKAAGKNLYESVTEIQYWSGGVMIKMHRHLLLAMHPMVNICEVFLYRMAVNSSDITEFTFQG